MLQAPTETTGVPCAHAFRVSGQPGAGAASSTQADSSRDPDVQPRPSYSPRIRKLIALALVLPPLTGCAGGGSHIVIVAPSGDRLDWASQLGTADAVPDQALVRRVKRAARASGALALDVSVLALTAENRHVPVVTLEQSDPASYMKHRLRGFLAQIGYFKPEGVAFVELLDTHGRFAWAAGRWHNGGLVRSRPDLDQCSPIVHSQLVGATVPQCPAD